MASPDFREVVERKRDGREIPSSELRDFIIGYARGEVPDYLAAAFLMAAFLNGLTTRETADLTRAMVDSGATLPLAGVTRPKVDKHSTGGVSDGVTLVLAPLAASLGLAVPKLSGRGLGHTGGTLDKLESIPGFRVALSSEELERQVEKIGCAVAGQTKELVPADGALYALRDATATVASLPLIAASVMSKKLAVGTDLILLDVKAGNGAFMKTPREAEDLAAVCVELARGWGRPARAAVTDMSQPLGAAIGNALEIGECIALLKGEEVKGQLRELSIAFAAEALVVLQAKGREAARTQVREKLDSGAAAETFSRMVEAQGGDPRVVEDPWAVLPRAPVRREVTSEGGYLAAVDTEGLGRAAAALGAGRMRKGDPIDPAVGIEFFPQIGDQLESGRPLALIHAQDDEAADAARARVQTAVVLSPEPVEAPPLVHGWHGATDLPSMAASGDAKGGPG